MFHVKHIYFYESLASIFTIEALNFVHISAIKDFEDLAIKGLQIVIALITIHKLIKDKKNESRKS